MSYVCMRYTLSSCLVLFHYYHWVHERGGGGSLLLEMGPKFVEYHPLRHGSSQLASYGSWMQTSKLLLRAVDNLVPT